ncbi:MAG: glycosyltransferase family 39 protein [Acidobacteriota bacterium]|nr:glycosyltransferase family 39 protein [Acidobacteriota bacterium]
MTGGAPLFAGLGGVLLFLAAGRGLVELLPALRERPRAARFAYSYLLGVAAVAGSTYLLGIAFDIRIGRGVVLAPVVLLVVSGLVARLLRRRTPARRSPTIHPPRAGVFAARFAFGVGAFIALGLFAAALTKPDLGWDGEMSWSAAARWVRADRSVTPRALADARVYVTHPRYPILMPLAQVAVQETFDLGDDRRAVKPLYAAFFPALLLVLFDLARRHAGTCAAALGTVALAVVPVLAFNDAGGTDGTFSDVPLGAFFGAGFLLLLGRARTSEAVAAGLLLGAAVLTKNEGLPFAVAALGAVAFLAITGRPAERRTRLTALGLAAAAVLGAGLALRVWQSNIPQRWDEDYAGRLGEVSLAKEARVRLPLLPGAVMREMRSREDLAGFPLAAALILAAGAGGLRRRIVPPIVLCLTTCFGAYVLALLLSNWGGVEQVHPTWARFLVMQLSLPLGVLLALALRTGWRARLSFSRKGEQNGVTRVRGATEPRSRGRRRVLLLFLAFATVPVLLVWLFASYRRGQVSAAPRAAARTVTGSTESPWKEDASLTGSLDEPAEGSSVQGSLAVRGWARLPDRDLEVTVFIDGNERASVTHRRLSRPDVQNALPMLGDCASAGYEFVYAFSAKDSGPHEVEVLFRTRDGRERHYPARGFIWRN